MQGLHVPAEVSQQLQQRRGTLHPFAKLDPKRTALVIIDMQVAYMDTEHGLVNLKAAHDIVPTINRLADVVRSTGGKVFMIKHTVPPADQETWTIMNETETPAFRARRLKTLMIGTPGHELTPALVKKAGDEVCLKNRYSAFFPGASDLPVRLRANGIDTVLIAGIATTVCCTNSARDAIMDNFRTIMISDATADASHQGHEAALLNFYTTIGDVYDSEMAANALRGVPQ